MYVVPVGPDLMGVKCTHIRTFSNDYVIPYVAKGHLFIKFPPFPEGCVSYVYAGMQLIRVE